MAQTLTLEAQPTLLIDAPPGAWSPPLSLVLAAGDEADDDEAEDDEEDDDEDDDEEEDDEDEEAEDDTDEDDEDDEVDDDEDAEEEARNVRGQLRRQNGHIAPQISRR